MTLSSQMARTDRMSGSWGGSSRRRRPAALTYGLAAAGVVLLGFVVWAFSGPNSAIADTGSTPPGPSAPLPTAPDPLANANKPAANPPAPAKPSALEMGAGGGAGASRPSDLRGAGIGSGGIDIPRAPTTLPTNTATNPKTTGPTLVPTTPTSGEIAAKPQTPNTPTTPTDTKPPAPANPTTPGAQKPPAVTPNPAPAPAPAATPPAAPPATPSDIQTRFAAAERAMKENRLVEARQLLNGALLDPRTPDSDREGLRKWMAQINDTLVFSPTIIATDPLVSTYTIAAGDSLAKVANRQGVATDWRLIQRVNKLASPSKISVGQKLKLVRGPFHAVVHKASFRMDIFAGEPAGGTASASAPKGGLGGAEGAEPGWIYIRSFPVGLGTEGSTPTGSFVVRPRSKLVNPAWTNPRTGEKFAKDDPKNPIGEFWLGLEGIDDSTRALSAYGVHGTIAPESIGREMSMGCVRMSDQDIALVYELLTEGVSVVRIVP